MSPVWLGIMMAINLQTSFLTPPFGFALFLFARRRAGGSPDSRHLSRYRPLRDHPGGSPRRSLVSRPQLADLAAGCGLWGVRWATHSNVLADGNERFIQPVCGAVRRSRIGTLDKNNRVNARLRQNRLDACGLPRSSPDQQ